MTPLPSTSEYLAHIAYDSVLFGYSGTQLKILIIEYHNTGLFALPGGFVKKNEDLDIAVKRGLKERTGLDKIYLEQFHTFGNVSRFAPETMKTILLANGYQPENDHWLLERFISVAYYALINYEDVVPTPDLFSDSINWYPIDQLPPLEFEHEAIVKKALQTLQMNIEQKLAGLNHLLPSKFTMKDLQNIYEAIIGTSIRRTTFQRKILSLGILERHEKLFTGEAHKAPYLYSFNETEKI